MPGAPGHPSPGGSAGLRIAGVSFAVTSREAVIERPPDPSYAPFITDHAPAHADVDVALEIGPLPDTRGMFPVFDSGQSWSLFLAGDRYHLVLAPPARGGDPVWITRFDRQVTAATIFCGELLVRREGGRTYVTDPLRYPLDQILLLHLLAQRGGAVVHAAGVEAGGKIWLFAGRSRAGKSTITRLLVERGLVPVNDDRIIVRLAGGSFEAHGTPWPGDAGIAVAARAPLAGIFHLRRAEEDGLGELDRPRALERLLPVLSIPWYDRDLTERSLALCEELTATVPSWDLAFRPGTGAADLAAGFLTR